MERTESKCRIHINSDEELVNNIRKRIEANGGLCDEFPEATKCMCQEFLNMEEGSCRCKLYFKTLNYDD